MLQPGNALLRLHCNFRTYICYLKTANQLLKFGIKNSESCVLRCDKAKQSIRAEFFQCFGLEIDLSVKWEILKLEKIPIYKTMKLQHIVFLEFYCPGILHITNPTILTFS